MSKMTSVMVAAAVVVILCTALVTVSFVHAANATAEARSKASGEAVLEDRVNTLTAANADLMKENAAQKSKIVALQQMADTKSHGLRVDLTPASGEAVLVDRVNQLTTANADLMKENAAQKSKINILQQMVDTKAHGLYVDLTPAGMNGGQALLDEGTLTLTKITTSGRITATFVAPQPLPPGMDVR